ncbi:MAG: response regulator [Candidatus Omnitrophica bacterium]|nr:response regulator [Candidatus Omnitrophota bacterium]
MENNPVKVLLLEDNPRDAQLVREALARTRDSSFSLEQTDRLSVAIQRLTSGGIDVVLTDLALANRQGLSAFLRIRAHASSVPIVVMADTLEDQRLAVKALHEGAQDFLVKREFDEKTISRVIRHAIERKQADKALEKAQAQTDLLLASLPSILIGLNPNGLVTHWNQVAETTFGIPAVDVINQSLSQCRIGWESQKVLAAIEDSKTKKGSFRLDDIRYRRPNGQEGLLGFTIIPLNGGDTGQGLGLLLFGADVTERKRLEQLKEEFVSTVSHELRTPLAMIKEGVTQVLDGILGETTAKQRQFLSICLEAINRLGRVVDELLDISKIEAGRLQLKRELIDIVSLAKEVSSAFHSQALKRSLKIKTNFSEARIDLYADKDKVIQVFTNLIANALRFTAAGYVEVALVTKEHTIECSVSDTGQGISETDFPKVFEKFQQFGRTAGPGEKGTGLGLAICKAIVELHGGKIWVESQSGKGTKFTFTLPKYTTKQLFREYVSNYLKEAVEEEVFLSILTFDIENFEALREKIGEEKATLIVRDLENLINSCLRRKADVAIKHAHAILVVLPATGKDDAMMVAKRVRAAVDTYVSSRGVHEEIRLVYQIASYPEDGKTADELLREW